MSSVANFCATRCAKFNSWRVWIASFIPPNVAVCLDYVFSSIIPGAVIKYFFGFGNDMVDFLFNMLIGNIISFVIVQVEQMVGGCNSKTRYSGYKLSWIIVSILLLAMVGTVSAVSLLK